jgi:transcriptional antiterminator Rof (Rho-off)
MAGRPEPYSPIDCAVHDQLESMAVLGTTATFAWNSGDGAPASATTRIRDIRVADGAEWLLLEDGSRVRLDHLVAITAHPGSTPGPLHGAIQIP